jgi:hypothetical protein
MAPQQRPRLVRRRAPSRGALVALASGLLLASEARAEERAPYVHLVGAAAVGDSLRLNNPFRLPTPLGKTPESVSTAAPYLDLSLAILGGNPSGWQHGVWTHLSLALSGVPQQVLAPSYAALRRGAGWMAYGRAGLPVVLAPDANVGGELAFGGVYLLSGGLGLTAEAAGTAFYGAATREVSATLVPLLSLQLGVVVDFEALP